MDQKLSLERQAVLLVDSLTDGNMSSIAYDTAWFARLETDNGDPLYPSTRLWLANNQHQDGSWGAYFETFHDRMISTLSAVTALASSHQRNHFETAIQRGLDYLRQHSRQLAQDPYETIGFELLFPALLAQARDLKLVTPDEDFAFIEDIRREKMARIPESWIYQPESPMTHNLEFLGNDVDIVRAQSLLTVNGSIGNSPSASAYLFKYLQDNRLATYLHQTHSQSRDGGIPNVRPFEVFEWSWVLYHLDLSGLRPARARRGTDYLKQAWRSHGLGFSASGVLPDSDDSAVVMKVLESEDWFVSLDFLAQYRSDHGYLCFPFERNPSISSNIHLYDALKDRTEPCAHEMRENIRAFLVDARQEGAYWTDKWHISPYYATCHAILALSPDASLIDPAIDWILETQQQDGSWGLFAGTLEETAYCLLALLTHDDRSRPEIKRAAHKGAEFLLESKTLYPEMWVGKGLYAPISVIESAIISARALFGQKGA